jgi:hypothetical protein
MKKQFYRNIQSKLSEKEDCDMITGRDSPQGEAAVMGMASKSVKKMPA